MTSKCVHAIPRAAWLGVVLVFGHFPLPTAAFPQNQETTKTEFLVSGQPVGKRGGRLVLSLRAEPKTLNPIIAVDAPSREVIGVMQADLIHIHRSSQLTARALAKSCKCSQ